MKTSNSNIKERRSAIVKAFLLVLIPMLFASMGTTLVNNTGLVDTEIINRQTKEIEAMKRDRDTFISRLEIIDEEWKSYQGLSQKSIKSGDSLNIGNLETQVVDQEKKLGLLLDQLESSIKDTAFNKVYLASIKRYRTSINNFNQWVKDRKNYVNEMADSERIFELEQLLADREKDLVKEKQINKSSVAIDSEIRNLEREINNIREEARDLKLENKSLNNEIEDCYKSKNAKLIAMEKSIQNLKLELENFDSKFLESKEKFNKRLSKVISLIDDIVLDLKQP